MKVAIVFDNRPRPETTGYYCRRALAKLVDVEHLLPEELNLIDPSIFDLFVFVDDGLDYPIPDHCRPKASWIIDTHIDFQRSLTRFGDSDFLFAAQKDGAAQLQQSLGRTVEWLPLACDPTWHRRIEIEVPQFDVVFVGSQIGAQRTQLLNQLSLSFPQHWFGSAYFDDMAAMYSRGRVGFNCSIANDLNMRLFEIPACGLPLVTNHIEGNGLEELFDVGRHLLTYRSPTELEDFIRRLLGDESLRSQIADAGRNHVHTHHTYDHRMKRLLQAVQKTKTVVQVPAKAADYFEFDRPEVRNLIPADAKRILDVGCARGRLGRALKAERRECHVTGVELNANAASDAEKVLDRVIRGRIDDLPTDEIAPESFDCIVFADVLEHLRNPRAVLEKCQTWLAPGGSIVVSVPNSRHHSVVTGLIEGNWTYERAGLLDDDHMRCFTRRELEKLFYRSGLELDVLQSVPGPGYRDWELKGRPKHVRAGSLSIECRDERDAGEFFVYQYLARAQRRSVKNHELTSIVIVTFNQLAFTKECIDSILLRTDEPIELILVDNGSTDGTPDYLRSISGAKVILNDDNRGFAPAVNQGLQVATGRQLMLLNNDCVVTTGWLEGLLDALDDHESNGLVGPVSNNVSGEQQIAIPYRDMSSMDGFAWDCRSHRTLTVTDRLVGFCLLFRRQVMDRIGLLDEQFEVGCFEDDDFCRRAQLAGFRSVIARNVFVHHYGSATFKGSGVDFGEIMQKNERRYREKWDLNSQLKNGHAEHGHAKRESRMSEVQTDCSDRYSLHQLADGQHLLQRKHVRLSLCMIVRDNEDTIEACLDSIYPWVDEIIIVDTGSTDRTPEICRSFGARLFEFPWCDDFSAARNESLKYARGEWIFWMDSDDTIPEDQGSKLRQLVYGSHDDKCEGYVMQVHCPGNLPGEATVVDHVKLFRNRPETRFEHRIHEQILPALRRIGGTVRFTDLYVVHSGSRQTPETRQRKLARDFRILKLDLERFPDHPFVLFNLGMTLEDDEKYSDAEDVLQRCLAVSGTDDSHVSKAHSLLVNCRRRLGRTEEALETAEKALTLYSDDKELLFRKGTLLLDLGQYQQAASVFEQVLVPASRRTFRSIDPSIAGYKARHNLALACQNLGKHQEAARHWLSAIEEHSSFGPGWVCLVRHYLNLGHAETAVELAGRMQSVVGQTADSAIAMAICHEASGEILIAVESLQTAYHATRDPSCLDELARILFAINLIRESVSVLQELVAQRPDDASVHQNLGSALLATGNCDDAVKSLQKSLELRPVSPPTTLLFARVLLQTGLRDEARAALEAAVELSPDNSELRAAVGSLN